MASNKLIREDTAQGKFHRNDPALSSCSVKELLMMGATSNKCHLVETMAEFLLHRKVKRDMLRPSVKIFQALQTVPQSLVRNILEHVTLCITPPSCISSFTLFGFTC
ncbi:hypothetical protein P5673_006441 [Acropora cervicornis]|uniref:Uncharacterized protein n=1 Tax=Acropora cervicornis TaxID=6130 RepID=A0AAD9QY11_ACRCE|nr:hypothetical protein P5673_006441 [Acropora cervicornis]